MKVVGSSSRGRKLGEYEVLFDLSSGGMGDVLLARKRGAGGFERLVAIKTIRSELRGHEQLRAMFLDEARLLSRLTHPAVAQVYDFGEQDGQLYLAMEYVAGLSFRQLIDGVDFSPGVACRAVAQACRGLHAAHNLKDEDGGAMGVVHRDVSPDNLMFSFDGAVQVLDFGIALRKGREAPVTQFGAVKGKPPYLSPEQVRGDRVDRRSDVFSVSAVLWEMLTREPLFTGDSIYEVSTAVVEREILPPSSVVGPLASGIDEIVMQGLVRDPDGRFETALAVAEALDSVTAKFDAESLSLFANRALAERREEHRRWLSDVRGGGALDKEGRDSGIVTAVSSDVSATVADIDHAEQAADDGTWSTEFAKVESGELLSGNIAASRVSRSLVALAGFLCLAGAGGVFLMVAGSTAEHGRDAGALTPTINRVAVASTSMDGGHHVIDASMVRNPRDADVARHATEVSNDAAVSAVESRRRHGASRRRRRESKPPRMVTSAARGSDAGVERARVGDTPAVTFGYLKAAASPWAIVRVDGKELKGTPVWKHRLPVGAHVVEFLRPDTKEVRFRTTVTVVEGKLREVIAPSDSTP